MRYCDTRIKERIGYDFYCDIANNIVEARKSNGMTQEELANKAKISLSRLASIENVKVRIDLDMLEKLSDVLGLTVNRLIDAEIDSQIGDCLYLISFETCPDFKLYQKATSKRMAFLIIDKKLKKLGVKYNTPRERAFVEIVGVPVTDNEIRDRFQKRTEEDLPLEKD